MLNIASFLKQFPNQCNNLCELSDQVAQQHIRAHKTETYLKRNLQH